MLYDKGGTTIYATSDTQWVIKVVEDDQRSSDELAVILSLRRNKPRHSIALPTSLYSLYGRTSTAGWYALKRYYGHVTVSTFCKENWRSLAIDVLQFLQDFHHNQGIAHMDIKKANILIDAGKTEFIVADYEHAERPHKILTRSYGSNYKWYYMAMGAEMDEPLVSWRLDLVALGYILASLTVPTGSPWTFEQKCWDKRSDDKRSDDKRSDDKRSDDKPVTESEDTLLALRIKEVGAADPIVLTYLNYVREISWHAREPPTRDFYGRLEKLFLNEAKLA